MSIFDFISKLVPDTKKSNIEDDISYTKKIYEEVVIPNTTAAKDILNLTKKPSRDLVETSDAFYHLTRMRKGIFMHDFVALLRNARVNLDTVHSLVKEVLEDNNYSDAMGLQKAHILRASGVIAQIGEASVKMVNFLMRAQEIASGGEDEITKEERKAYINLTNKLFSLIAHYGQDPETFKKLIRSIPESMVTPHNARQVAAMFARDADPFAGADVNGFLPHPVLFVREQIANFQISRYEYNKKMKKLFELRVMALRAQQSGQDTASIQKQIQYYENEAAKLAERIEAFEAKYGA